MRRYLVLVATLVPVAYMFVFVAIFAAAWSGADDESPFGPVLIGVHLAIMLWSLGLLAFYLVHAARNPALDETLRVVWIIALVLASIVAMLAYWWMYVRPVTAARR